MSSIDERVVEMKFNNAQFQKGVADTNKSLGDLKKGLDLKGSAASLSELDAAGKRFSLANIAQGVETIASKFNALTVIGVTALATITQSAIAAGSQLVKSLTVDPIKQGLQEYETNLNSIQTILANTQASGATLTDVNSALAELNTYSDQTIYNFAEMARNIGTFTAAGVGLKESTASIKGIANLAALSGSNSQQAATAMYQLSQAISSGKVGLMDWNSVVNAGMGGTVFQRALATTAVKMGQLEESAVSLEGPMQNVKIAGESFRDSISADGGGTPWLSKDVLTATLQQFTGDLTDAELAAQGFSEAEIAAIQQTAKTAKAAATEVKTVTQLMGTLQETAGSGWAKTWQLIFGDFEEAKAMWSGVYQTLSGMIDASSDARNNMLQDWKDMGGRTALIDTVKNAFTALMSVVTPIKDAFREIFPATTGEQLYNITVAIRDFAATLTLSGENSANLKSTFKGIFAVLDIGRMIIVGLFGVFADLFGMMDGGGTSILNITGSLGDFLVSVRDAIKNGEGLTKFFTGLKNVLAVPLGLLVGLGKLIGSLFTNFETPDFSGFDGVLSIFGRIGDRLGQIGETFRSVWDGATAGARAFFSFISPLTDRLGEVFGGVMDGLKTAFSSGNFDSILDLINTGLLAGVVLLIKKFVDKFTEGGDDIAGGFLDKMKGILDGVTGSLEQMQANLKADTLLKIAGALALLTVSIVALSFIDSAKLAVSLGAITVMMGQLAGAMAVFEKIGTATGAAKMTILGAAMIVLAIAIGILALAVGKLAGYDWDELAKGLTGVAVLMGLMVGLSKGLSKSAPGMITTGIAMVILASSLLILAKAVEKFSGMSWAEMAKGMAGVAVGLGVLAGAMRLMPTNMAVQAASLVVVSAALFILSSALEKMSGMTWGELAVAMAALAGSMAILAVGLNLMTGALGGAAALVVASAALLILSDALASMGGMSWGEFAVAMATLAGSLAIIAGGLYLMTAALPGAAALVIAAAALVVLSGALQEMATMSWSEFGKVMAILAGSLIILAVGLTAMVAALPGAAALVIAAGALAILAPVLTTLGEMTWAEIGAGLTVLAAALTIIGVAGILLIPALPGLIGLGIAMGLIGVGVLAAGVGLLAFSVGLTALTASGAILASTITVLLGAVIAQIPFAMEQFALGVVAFANVIAVSGPAFVGAITTVLLSLIAAIRAVAPQIIDTLWMLVLMMADRIAQGVPVLVDRGAKLVIGILNGIAANIGGIVAAAANLIVQFINGISAQLPRIIQSGINLVISFVQGLADGINRNSARMREAGLSLATAIVDGMTGGLASGASRAIQAAKDMASKALSAAKDLLGIASPSKEFFKVGAWSAEGAALGIEKNSDMMSDAVVDMGNEAMSNLKSSMARLGDIVTNEMNTAPTITPVLDLSAIQRDSRLVNGMFGSPTLDVGRPYAEAAAIERSNAEAQFAAKTAVATDNSGPKIELKQYNNSPKALDAVEIYRNTKNLLSTTKEVIKKP